MDNEASPQFTGADEVLSPTERTVVHVWTEVLRIDGLVGLHDNFFALGGDSIAVMTMLFSLQQMLGIELSPAVMFDAPTPMNLARLIDSQLEEGTQPEATLQSGWI
jgi:acyl carrier protein